MSPDKQRRGFAAMNPETHRAIAAKGGITAHQKGTAHQWTHDQAVAAGRKGGVASGKIRKPSARLADIDEQLGNTGALR
jgi:general stress protein YciG